MTKAEELRERKMRDELNQLKREFEELRESMRRQQEADARTIANLREENEYLKAKLFSPSREKLTQNCEGQLNIFNEAEMELPENDSGDIPDDLPIPEVTEKRSRKPRVTNQEKYKDLEKEKVIHSLPEEERVCSECGSPMTPCGTRYLYTEVKHIPAKLIAVEHWVESYSCKACQKENIQSHIEVAPHPQPVIPHSFASEEVIAEVVYQKFANSLPFYRQEKEWKQMGMNISRADMASWVIYAAENYFEPVYGLIHRELLKRSFLMADETRIQVLKEAGRKAESNSYMWLYRSGEDGLVPLVLYQYTETRAAHNAREFLSGYKGYLMTDGYQGYDNLPDITRCCCWAHVRRYFFDAIPKGQNTDLTLPAVQGVLYCDELFKHERISQEKKHSAERRKEYRISKEKPILTAFWSWLEKQNHDPQSKIGKAVQYARNRKPFLENYLQDGRCSFSNNLSENAIRPFTLGRKNWLFSDTPKGAKGSAIAYTMVELAKVNGLSVRAYLKYILSKRPDESWSDEQLRELLPDNAAVLAACKLSK